TTSCSPSTNAPTPPPDPRPRVPRQASDQPISSQTTPCCNLLRRPGNGRNGLWRSLVAHLTGGQVVAGSNPVSPTAKTPSDLGRKGFSASATRREIRPEPVKISYFRPLAT